MVNKVGSHRNLAMCWGSKSPVFSIGYETDRVFKGDSGFSLLFDDAPLAEELVEHDSRITWVCLHCLIEEHPEIGRGLDLARMHGAADLDENDEWVGRTVEQDPSP